MTPVKKVLYEQEQDDQKQIETNSNQQQSIQLKASFIIQKVCFVFLKTIFYFFKLD
jgi:hypothetical protein